MKTLDEKSYHEILILSNINPLGHNHQTQRNWIANLVNVNKSFAFFHFSDHLISKRLT